MNSRYLLLPAALLLSGLTGCAGIPADWGRSDVVQMASDRGRQMPEVADIQTFTDKSLRQPLTSDTAVQLALLNNPEVRNQTAKLGFAAAERYDAARLANPTFSLTRLSGDSSAGGNMPLLTLGIALDFTNLLFLPANKRFAEAEFEAAKLEVAAATLDLAAEVEQAWLEAVGAEQMAQMREAAAKAQQASASLAQRFFDAGNINALELSTERAAASQAVLAAISARAEAVTARSALNRLMGLSAAQSQWTLEARLPELPAGDETPEDLQTLALNSRLDVASLRERAEAIAGRFNLTRKTRWINGIEVGAERERDFDGAVDAGPTLSLELPLFNWGGGRVAAIHAAMEQAEAELDQRVLEVSNDVQLTTAKLGATRELAEEYRLTLIPAVDAVVKQSQLEQNYMLIGVFELILAKQQAYEAYAGYLESVRDYWIARSELSRVVGRDLPRSSTTTGNTLAPEQFLKPKGDGMDHSQHSMGGMPGMDHSMHGAMPSGDGKSKPMPQGHAGHSMKDKRGVSGKSESMSPSTSQSPDASPMHQHQH